MRVVVVEPNAGLRQIFDPELEEVGFSRVGAESLEDAMRLAAKDPPDVFVPTPALKATVAPASDAQFIRDLRANARMASVPVGEIAFTQGSERPSLDAGASCCLRALQLRGDILKAVDWAISVYGERRGP